MRREPLDALDVDDEAVLLLPPDRVVRLSLLATMVFDMTSGGRSLVDPGTVVEERFGSPADRESVGALLEIIHGSLAASVLERVDNA